MLFLDYMADKTPSDFAASLNEFGIKITAGNAIRLVLHKDVFRADCERFVDIIKKVI